MAPEEQLYIPERTAITKRALEQLLGSTLTEQQIPRIAFCCSGGGYRAMVAALGSLACAQDTRLLDAVTYTAGLSGSTWALALWNQSGMTISQVIKLITPCLASGLFETPNNMGDITRALLRKLAFDQCISLVDIYGTILGQKLLMPSKFNAQDVLLSTHVSRLQHGAWPMPLYTCVVAHEPYEWLEFTPYEISSPYVGGSIPTWAFGRQFNAGVSSDSSPSDTLPYMMGIWGSAFTASIEEIYQLYKNSIKLTELKAALEKLVTVPTVGNTRLSPALVPNFGYGLANSALKDNKILTLVDAGLSFNLPFPPLLKAERAVDIIIVLENSAGVTNASELRKAAAYAASHHLPFPQLPALIDDSKAIQVFNEYPKAPIVLYMPLVKNAAYSTFDPVASMNSGGYCSTFNLLYSAAQVQELSGLTYTTMHQSLPTIIEIIKTVSVHKLTSKR